jgi:DNA-binding NarL/FixJ family response regulator
MTEKNKLEIVLSVEGTIKDKFLAIKEKLGVSNNTEVLRYAISQAHKIIFGENKNV